MDKRNKCKFAFLLNLDKINIKYYNLIIIAK